MININIICLGKLKEDYLRMACAEYEKRLGAFCKLKVTELTPARLPDNPNDAQIEAALNDESERILAKISPNDAVFALCNGSLPYVTGQSVNVDGGFHIRRL